MANIDTSKLVNLGNLQYYDQKIKDYTEEKIKEINLSDLADDAEHRTVTDTEKASWNAKSDFSGSYEDLSDVPSDLATTDNVASALNEAKVYTDNELAKFDFIKVVDGLPETGLTNKIYLVPKNDTQTQDLFDEWIYVNKGTEDAPEYVWEWITTKQLEVDLTEYATTEYVDNNKTQIVTTSGTGSAYTATVPGITALTPGVSFVMIPHVESRSSTPTLNVNGLGAVGLRRQSSIVTAPAQTGYNLFWLAANYPITVMYNGTYWIVKDLVKPSAADLMGTVTVSKGGTGTSTLAANAVITGNGTSAVKTITTASGALYATEENGVAQFGTLPIAQGGTGATTATDAVANLKSPLIDLIYPVGSCFTSSSGFDPNAHFGGYWWGVEGTKVVCKAMTSVVIIPSDNTLFAWISLSDILTEFGLDSGSKSIYDIGISLGNGDGLAQSGGISGWCWRNDILCIYHNFGAGPARINATFYTNLPDGYVHWWRKQ